MPQITPLNPKTLGSSECVVSTPSSGRVDRLIRPPGPSWTGLKGLRGVIEWLDQELELECLWFLQFCPCDLPASSIPIFGTRLPACPWKPSCWGKSPPLLPTLAPGLALGRCGVLPSPAHYVATTPKHTMCKFCIFYSARWTTSWACHFLPVLISSLALLSLSSKGDASELQWHTTPAV